jgi:hypothetical protein
MAQATMTTVDNILKEVYEDGGINDQLQSEITALKRVERSSEGVTHEAGGKYVKFPIRTQRNHGIGARLENEPLPVAQYQTYEAAQVKLKYQYGALQLTGQTFELAEKNFQAFASALDSEVSGVKEGLRKDLARQVYGTGDGKLGTATAAGTTTTFVIDNEAAIYPEPGMIIDTFDSGGVSTSTGNTIVSVTVGATTTTVTIGTALALATAADDYFTRAGSATGGTQREWTGLGAMLSTTLEIYNIDPATVPIWKANVLANGGVNRALTEALMIQSIDAIRRAGGGTPTVGFMSLGVRRAYFELLKQERRVVNTQEFTGGFKGLAFVVDDHEIPLMSDVDCPPNRIEFLNEKEIKLYQTGDWSFMERDGSKWQRVITSAGAYDAYQATLYQYSEIGTHRRNSHALLSDLTEA